MQTSSTSTSSSSLPVLLLTKNGDMQVKLKYSEQTHTVTAKVLDGLGKTLGAISSANMPKEFAYISSSFEFEKLVNNALVKVMKMGNGEFHFSLVSSDKKGVGVNKSVLNLNEDPDLVEKIMAIVREGKKGLEKVEVKSKAVVIVGRTGAGKSLLGNLLSEKSLKGFVDGFHFKFDVDDPIFPISHSKTASCTGVPNVHSPRHKDFTYIDLPGFDDTREPEQDIGNLFFRKEILQKAKKLEMVFVVKWEDLERGTYFSSTFNDLIQFLGFTDVQDERLENLAQSIVLVVTHTPPMDNNATRQIVKKALQEHAIAKYGLSDNAKAILTKIIADNRWETFSAPSAIGTSPKVTEDQMRIRKRINESPYIDKRDTTILAKVNPKHEGKVQNALINLISDLKKRFAAKVLYEVTESLKKFYQQVPDKKALKKFQKKYHQIISSKEPCTLSEMLKNLQFRSGMFASGLLDEAKINDENMQFLFDLLPEKLTVNLPTRRDWLGEIGVRESLSKWDEILAKMTEEAKLEVSPTPDSTPSDPKNKLVLNGYFPKISQITAELSKHQNIRKIEVHGLHTVEIDEDLNLHDIDVVMVAPKFKVRNNRTINLTGKDSRHTYSKRATDGATHGAHGADGNPGLPGGNGGHFLAICHSCPDLEHLTVISNGGTGSRGQSGGVGHVGKDGEDGSTKVTFTKDMAGAHNEQIARSQGWDFVQIPPFHHGGGKYDQELKMDGKAGQAGGNGGKAGTGGLGGQPGTVEFISLNDPKSVLKSIINPGKEGEAGESGAPGLGGRNGRIWKGQWHTGGNPDHGWNGHATGLPQFYPPNKDQCPRVNSGTEPTSLNSVGRTPPHLLRPFNALEYLSRYWEFAISNSNSLTSEAMEIFHKYCVKNSAIVGKENVDNFIAECDRMEDFFTKIEDKTKCLPLYEWMRDRIQDFNVPSGNPTGAALIQILYTYILSKIFQIRATMESRLIIDIKGFLKLIEKNLDILKQHDHAVKVDFYKTEYLEHLNSKIAEADVFIKKLSLDIRAADKEIEDQIKQLLNEINDIKQKNSTNKRDIIDKREELKALINRRKTLGFIGIAVQAIGCCFPPAGPIVAGVVGAGITMINHPRTGVATFGQALSVYTDAISGALQNNKLALTNANQAVLTRLRDVSLTTSLLDAVGDTSKTEEEQIQAMDKAIAEIDKQQKQLDSFRNSVSSSLEPSLHELVDGAEDIQKALQGQSKIALEFNRLSVKRAFENVKRQIKDSTKSFASGDGFLTIIKQLEEAIETTANIYDHIEEYKERRVLVSYMARLAAPTASADSRIDVYKQKVQRNLILEMYARAFAAVKQWAFPFASNYVGDFATLKQFNATKTIDDLMNLITQHLLLLRNKVMGSDSQVNSTIDPFVWRGKFSKQQSSGPFYIWKHEENPKEFVDLLRGEPVVLYADINRTSPAMHAVKFRQIQLQIRSSDPILQRSLPEILKGITVEMRHSGLSNYRYEDKIYQMSNDNGFCIGFTWGHDENKPEAVNNVYKKINEEFMLSPYAHWAIKLQGVGDLHKKLANNLHTLEIHLVGKGQYVKAKEAAGKVNPADDYNRNIVFMDGAPPQVKAKGS